MSDKRKNLVVTRAGHRTLHEQWLQPHGFRNFDVLVTSYEHLHQSGAEDGVSVVYLPGRKVEGWSKIVSQFAEQIGQYERVAFMDDDIACDAAVISACFDIGKDYDLSIWQPSLSWNSFFTYGGTLHNPNFKLRFVNYVEMMCPFFSSSALKRVQPTFFLGFESGIDLLWCSLIPIAERRCAIVDAVQIHHTRPVGQDKAANGFTLHSYEDEIEACLELFRMSWPSLVASHAVLREGRDASRLSMAWRVFSLLCARRVTPDSKGLRKILDHIRHQILRPQVFNERAPNLLKELSTTRSSNPAMRILRQRG